MGRFRPRLRGILGTVRTRPTNGLRGEKTGQTGGRGGGSDLLGLACPKGHFPGLGGNPLGNRDVEYPVR